MNQQVAEPPQPPVPAPALPVVELISSLEQATLMAKQLPNTIDQAQLLQIYSTLRQAHHHLASFLSSAQPQQPPISSAIGFANDGSEPMQTGDEEKGEEGGENGANEENSAMDKVEERMREGCFIKNKRPKRPLSPEAKVVEERRVYEDGCESLGGEGDKGGFDQHGSKLRALDLVYQFHG